MNAKTDAKSDEKKESRAEKKQRKAENKKKRNPFVKFILGLLKFILFVLLFIVIALVAWFTFSVFNKKSMLSVVPQDFSVFVKTDSVWDTAEPLLDLKAADIVFAEPKLAKARGAFMNFRSSELRNNKIIQLLGKRKVNAAVYITPEKKVSIVGIVELGALSAVTRLAPVVLPHIYVENLSFNAENNSFTYHTETTDIYFKAYYNMAIVSTDYDLFLKSISGNNNYTFSQISALTKNDDQKLKIYLDTKNLVSLIQGKDELVSKLEGILDYSTYSQIAFDINDSDIKLKINVPYINTSDVLEKYPVIKSSTVPAIVSKLPETVQYYTVYNAGTLQELKDSVFPFLPADKNINALWDTGNRVCGNMLNASIEDLLFSWSGKEIAVLGLEGQNDPVFALQVADEVKRQEIFNKVLSSLLMSSDNSLILNGVRMPRLALPSYIQNILDAFGVSLPMPYFIVENGYAYFSQSAECLSNLHSAFAQCKTITKNENYEHVSKNMDNSSFLSLYYDLQKTVPFFIRSKAKISQILELYNLGKCDFSFRNGNIVISLQATAENASEFRDMPGFPVDLVRRNDGLLYSENTKNVSSLFWVQDGVTVCSMEIPAVKVNTLELNEKVYVAAANVSGKDSNVIWAVTNRGTVYLLNRKLEVADNFPVVTEYSPVDKITCLGDSAVYATSSGTVVMINTKGEVRTFDIPVSNGIFSKPSVLDGENLCAVYDKGFIGGIYFIKDEAVVNAESPLQVAGIGFGSPALLKIKNDVYTAFITQAGLFHLWKNNELVENYPVKLDGVYSTNAIALKDGFAVISESGVISVIKLDGEVISVALPSGSAKKAYLSTSNGDIFVSADSNTIYGFNSGLELLFGYPVTGWGTPAFTDVNGDNKKECFALGLDNKMYCWNIN